VRHLAPSNDFVAAGFDLGRSAGRQRPVVLVRHRGRQGGGSSRRPVLRSNVLHARCALVFGLAGAAGGDGRPGQLIVASGALQHDVDARPLADARGTIPFARDHLVPGRSDSIEKLRQATAGAVENPHIVTSGVVLTGDQIVASRKVKDALLRDFSARRVFRHGDRRHRAGRFQNGVPWAALRVTSDAADESFDLAEVIGFGINRSRSVRPIVEIPERPVGREV